MCHLLRMAGVAEEVETTRIAAWTKWKTKRYRGLLLLEALCWGGGSLGSEGVATLFPHPWQWLWKKEQWEAVELRCWRCHGTHYFWVFWQGLLVPSSWCWLPSSGDKLTWKKGRVNASEHLTLAILFPCRLLPQHLYSHQRISSP